MGGGGWQEVKFLKKGSLKSMMWNESLQTRRSPETGLRKSCDISKSCHRSSITLARLSRRKAEKSQSFSPPRQFLMFTGGGGGGGGGWGGGVLVKYTWPCWIVLMFLQNAGSFSSSFASSFLSFSYPRALLFHFRLSSVCYFPTPPLSPSVYRRPKLGVRSV